MARPKKSVRVAFNKPRDSRPLRELREDLPFEEPTRQDSLRHVLERLHRLREGPRPRRLRYPPAGGPGRARLVVQRDLILWDTSRCGCSRKRGPISAVPVAYYFVQVGLPEPGEWEAPPASVRRGSISPGEEAECPVDTREASPNWPAISRCFLPGSRGRGYGPPRAPDPRGMKPITVSDLHALMAAVRRARPRPDHLPPVQGPDQLGPDLPRRSRRRCAAASWNARTRSVTWRTRGGDPLRSPAKVRDGPPGVPGDREPGLLQDARGPEAACGRRPGGDSRRAAAQRDRRYL